MSDQTRDNDPMTALDVMQYADGELDQERAQEVAAFVESETGREQLLAMAEISDGVRSHIESATSERAPDFAKLWATIERRITANGAAPHGVATPSEIPPERARRGFFAELGAWLDRYRGHFVTGAVAAGAAAALMVAIGDPPSEQARNPAVADRPPVFDTGPRLDSFMDPSVAPVALASQPPEVEQLEVYGGSGMVLTLPDEDGGGTAVIWLSGEDNATESPI